MRDLIIKGKDATIVTHLAKGDGRSKFAREYELLPPRAYSSVPIAVVMRYKQPRQRDYRYEYIIPSGYLYFTIERDGEEIYDSRDEVPCDMDVYRELQRLMEVSGYSQTTGYVTLGWKLQQDLKKEALPLFTQAAPKKTSRRRSKQMRPDTNVVDLASVRKNRERA